MKISFCSIVLLVGLLAVLSRIILAENEESCKKGSSLDDTLRDQIGQCATHYDSNFKILLKYLELFM